MCSSVISTIFFSCPTIRLGHTLTGHLERLTDDLAGDESIFITRLPNSETRTVDGFPRRLHHRRRPQYTDGPQREVRTVFESISYMQQVTVRTQLST